MIEKIIPLIAVIIFISLLIFVRKTNPENKKIRTRTSFYSIFRKEICPNCNIKMNKRWIKKDLGLSLIESNSVYEEEMQPEFVCKMCNYKIEAKFSRKY